MIGACKKAGLVLREGVFALGVLALLLLSFAHQPVALPADNLVRVQAAQLQADWCGNTPNGEHEKHGPCHACRVSVADLPGPGQKAEAAFGCGLRVAYFQPKADLVLRSHRSSNATRAPPIIL